MKVDQLQVSVIIPVYNAEKFLEECIDSITQQDIGFTENIELVLVNDGSRDASEAICRAYKERYPKNIKYISQKNAGASEARNTGIKAATGKFISFVDADDYLSKESVGAVMKFFETASDEVDIATIRVIQFGTKNRSRPINRKFNKGTRIIDLHEAQWYDICPRIAPSFIRSEIAKKHRFHKDIRFYEDTRYFNEIAARTMKLGVVAEGTYYNRKHDESDANASITTSATHEKRFYLDSSENVSLYLLNKNKKKTDDYPPLYFQYLAQYEIRWRMFYNTDLPQVVLTAKEYAHYQKVNKEILALISDEAIIGFKLHHEWQRVHLLNLKHDKDIISEATFNDDRKLVWNDHIIFNHMRKLQVQVSDAYVANHELVVKGAFADFITKDVQLSLLVDDKKCSSIELFPESVDIGYGALEYPARKRTGFVARIPIKRHEAHHIRFTMTIKGEEYPVRRLVTPEALLGKLVGRYRISGEYLINWRRESINVAPHTAWSYVKLELGRVNRRIMVLLHKR